jgi:hypothetical protein
VDDVVDFLNTLDVRSFSRHGVVHTGGDVLSSSAALADWLADHSLLSPGTRMGKADLLAALGLRAALRAALSQQESLADAVLTRFPLRLTVGPAGTLDLAPAGGAHVALGRLVATVAHAVADGRWRRVRLCAAQDCRWAFHDTSRSGAGRWCSMAVCGNRQKTRAYRALRKGEAG